MRFEKLVCTSLAIARTRKRLEKIDRLADLFRALPRDAIAIGVAYLAGQVPQGRIGIGYAKLRDTQHVPPAAEPSLELLDIHRTLDAIVETTGAGSQKRRLELLEGLLAKATADEQVFLRRLLIGEIRQGALESIAVEGLAKATGVDAAKIRRAQMLANDLGGIASAVILEGEAALARFDLRLFTPIHPMLAHTAEDVDAALEQLEEAIFELKVDGARVQVHKQGDEVRVFSRRMNEVTPAVPEIVEAARRWPVESIVLDGETIALRKDGTPHSFQTTMRRFGRRLDVDALRAKLPLTTSYFDVLHVNGATVIDEPATQRNLRMEEALPVEQRIERVVTRDRDDADAFYARALDRGHEGVMAKALDATYEAGNRGKSWLKLKHVHTLDLVVIGVEWGSGRRKGWLSNLHLGARDPKSGRFVMLGKTFKGMTDAMLTWQTEKLLSLETSREGHVVWVKPELVVEIAFNDVQHSPHYPAGVALRFARVKRYREDKKPEEADLLPAVLALLPD
ncbi:MAG: ATP-dependent DNA ligase [Deltaproteobacteria bacterium]